jgi:hypothetical protein
MLSSSRQARPYNRALTALCVLLASALIAPSVLAQDSERWYQVEVSIFAYGNSNANEELFAQDSLALSFPNRLNKLRQVSDALQLNDWSVLAPASLALPRNAEQQLQQQDEPIEIAKPIGPRQFVSGNSFTMPDVAREPFLYLPATAHDFWGTNRALERSENYRLLYHGAWRQPMLHDNRDTAIGILAGRQFGERRELEGSLRLYFNRAEDRVVFEPNIWLTSFSVVNNASGIAELPRIPSRLAQANKRASTGETTQYFVSQVIPLHQSREMRSNEFHYIDHPALGILVQIAPYTPPAPIEPPTSVDLPRPTDSLDPLSFQ